MQTCEFPLETAWTLLYRASEDGFDSKDFHTKCDAQANTLTIIKVDGSAHIFGGYTSVAWDLSGIWKHDANAFIFSLVNQEKKPLKMKVIRPQYAICAHAKYGPMFGGFNGNDICIKSNSNLDTASFSDLGSNFKHPRYSLDTVESQTFLAGSRNFKVSGIEVYAKK